MHLLLHWLYINTYQCNSMYIYIYIYRYTHTYIYIYPCFRMVELCQTSIFFATTLLILLPGAWNCFQGLFNQGLSGVDLSFSRRLRDGWLWPWWQWQVVEKLVPRGPAFWTFLNDFGESKTQHILVMSLMSLLFLWAITVMSETYIIGQEEMLYAE